MIETERIEISDNTPISQTTIHGKASVWFGLPFAAVGLFILLAATNAIPNPDDSWNAPRWVGGCMGAIFGLAGLALLVNGAAGIRREASIAKGQLERPAEVWAWDYPWNVRGAHDRGVHKLLKSLWAMAFLAIFLVPFNYWAWFSNDGGLMVGCIVGLFDLIWLVVAGNGIYQTLQRLKYGPSRLRFARFPFLLGERAELQLFPSGRVASARAVRATLRCIEERFETRGTGKNRKQLVIAYQLWAESLEIPVPSQVEAAGIALQFALPEAKTESGSLATRLSARPATYWRLEVSASTPGIDYEAMFLVPVYEEA